MQVQYDFCHHCPLRVRNRDQKTLPFLLQQHAATRAQGTTVTKLLLNIPPTCANHILVHVYPNRVHTESCRLLSRIVTYCHDYNGLSPMISCL